MILKIDELRDRKDPLVIERDFSEGELGIGSQLSALGRPVHAVLRLELAGEQLHVEGELAGLLALKCCRCLDGFEERISKEFELAYRPDPAPAAEGEEIFLDYEDLTIGFYRNGEFDVCGMISEQVVLEVPMKPICREDCKGLCDQCGTDLNQAECGCQAETLDPRLEILLELKKRMGSPH